MARAFFPGWRHALLLLAVAGSSGCIRAHARAVPEIPSLDVPAPPPRVVEPIVAATPQPGVLIEEPARNPVPPPPPPAPAPRAEAPRADPRTETPPPEPAKVTEEGPRPATTLQTAPAEREGEWEQRIRGVLTAASTNLNRVKGRALADNAKSQVAQAQRFITQAEEALRAKNLVFADNLADKAATLAAQLAGR
jgi:hypothetical protein